LIGPGSFIVRADDAMEGEVDAEDDDEATVEDDSGPEEGDQAVRETEQVLRMEIIRVHRNFRF
jgi:hypothetical protein